MTKKTHKKKTMLGSRTKRSRRIPVLAQVRTHRRIQYNKFGRSWRRTKLKLKEE
jgi:ribosomal protein L39E